MRTKHQVRPDLQKAWVALDKMPHCSMVEDRDGVRWREDGWGFWHSEHPEPERSSFQLAQLAPITVITNHETERR